VSHPKSTVRARVPGQPVFARVCPPPITPTLCAKCPRPGT